MAGHENMMGSHSFGLSQDQNTSFRTMIAGTRTTNSRSSCSLFPLAALLAIAILSACGESGSLAIPAKIDPTLGASRETSGNGMQFRFKTIANISYPAGYFSGGREYFWGVELTLADSASAKLAADTSFQIAFISDRFATPNNYDLSDILAGGSADIYQLRTIGDTTSYQRIEAAKVVTTSDGFALDISNSEILRPKLEASPPTGFSASAEGNLMVRRRFSCSYPLGQCSPN